MAARIIEETRFCFINQGPVLGHERLGQRVLKSPLQAHERQPFRRAADVQTRLTVEVCQHFEQDEGLVRPITRCTSSSFMVIGLAFPSIQCTPPARHSL